MSTQLQEGAGNISLNLPQQQEKQTSQQLSQGAQQTQTQPESQLQGQSKLLSQIQTENLSQNANENQNQNQSQNSDPTTYSGIQVQAAPKPVLGIGMNQGQGSNNFGRGRGRGRGWRGGRGRGRGRGRNRGNRFSSWNGGFGGWGSNFSRGGGITFPVSNYYDQNNSWNNNNSWNDDWSQQYQGQGQSQGQNQGQGQGQGFVSAPSGPTALQAQSGNYQGNMNNTWFGFTNTDPSAVYEQPREFDDYVQHIKKASDNTNTDNNNTGEYEIDTSFNNNMKIIARFYANEQLYQDAEDELYNWTIREGRGAQPTLIELSHLATLPSAVDVIGLPNMQPGFGFPHGCVTAFNLDNPNCLISPNGVGIDCNNGVRLLKSNIIYDDIQDSDKLRLLADELYGKIPMGIGVNGSIYTTNKDLHRVLEMGLDWAIERGYAWEDDKNKCEDSGRLNDADSNLVTFTSLLRGKNELGSLGTGGHYLEVQCVDEIYDQNIAEKLGLNKIGQLCVMIKSGSRGFGHQIAKDYVRLMCQNNNNNNNNDTIQLNNDPHFVAAKLSSKLGKDYYSAMCAATNFAWVNRSGLAHLTRQAFETVFNKSPKELEMYTVLDNNYNSIRKESIKCKGIDKKLNLLIHRNGCARSLPAGHNLCPIAYKDIGNPVLLDGGMGSNSYIVIGTKECEYKTLGSTCSGSGRAITRQRARFTYWFEDIQQDLINKGVIARLGNRRLAIEEAPENFKDIDEIVQTCEDSNLTKTILRLAPVIIVRC